MLHKTKAISLQSMAFRDSSVIARFFTEKFGLQSFVVNGVRSARSRIPASLFQPMVPVDLIQYHDERKDLHRISEIKAASILHNLPMHPAKAAMAMFVAEYLGRVLKDHLENKPFFEFSLDWIHQLDGLQGGFESAHLGFVWHSFSYLGISPEDWRRIPETVSGIASSSHPAIQEFLEAESSFSQLRLPSAGRQQLLDALVRYAGMQLEGMGELRSLSVLRQVFS